MAQPERPPLTIAECAVRLREACISYIRAGFTPEQATYFCGLIISSSK